MMNVNHKIKCTYKGTPILCYIKNCRLQTVHAYHNALPGKVNEWDFCHPEEPLTALLGACGDLWEIDAWKLLSVY